MHRLPQKEPGASRLRFLSGGRENLRQINGFFRKKNDGQIIISAFAFRQIFQRILRFPGAVNHKAE